MKIYPVSDEKDWKAFHRVPHRIYANDPHWICPPESDLRSIFDPSKNKTFGRGEAALFVLEDAQGSPAGRIAAFIDHARNEKQEVPTGGIGFFECTENGEYAAALFEAAESWLAGRGIKAVEGPVNFGERERYWGLLVKGFYPPLFQEPYHPRYYEGLFRKNGYQPYEQILTFKGEVANVPVEKFRRVAAVSAKRYGLHAEFFDMKRLDLMAQYFCQVYNRAFAKFEHHKHLGAEQMQSLFGEFKPIADKVSTCMVYHGERPVGFCVLLPDINPFLRQSKGRMNGLALAWFMLRFKLARRKSLKGIAFGIDPDFQGRGVFPVMIYQLCNDALFRRYPQYYLAGIRGHNRIMVDSILNLGVGIDRVHVAFRKMLDERLELNPFPFVEVPGLSP